MRDLTSLPPLAADERVFYGSDPNQFFDLWRPTGPDIAASAVTIHGGFWRARYDLGHTSHMCAALARSGIFVANIEYRRVGQPGGGWPGSFEDVIAGVRAATKHFGSAPLVLGHSAGGHLALRLAAEPVALRAVVALAPVANLRLAYELNLSNGAVAEFVNATPEARPDVYADACPSRHPAPVRRILIHGVEDEVVPVAVSRAFAKARQSDEVPPLVVEILDARHMDLIDPESRAWPVVLDALLALLQE